jgi:hypothetical protein
LVHVVEGAGRRIVTGRMATSTREAVDIALAWVDRNLAGILQWFQSEDSGGEEDEEDEEVRLLQPHLDVCVSLPMTSQRLKTGTSLGAAVALSLVLHALRPVGMRPRVEGGDGGASSPIGVSGEINLRGVLLPVLDVRAKVGAAMKAKCGLLVLPAANRGDVAALVGGADTVVGSWVRQRVVLATDLLHMLQLVIQGTHPRTEGGRAGSDHVPARTSPQHMHSHSRWFVVRAWQICPPSQLA